MCSCFSRSGRSSSPDPYSRVATPGSLAISLATSSKDAAFETGDVWKYPTAPPSRLGPHGRQGRRRTGLRKRHKIVALATHRRKRDQNVALRTTPVDQERRRAVAPTQPATCAARATDRIQPSPTRRRVGRSAAASQPARRWTRDGLRETRERVSW